MRSVDRGNINEDGCGADIQNAVDRRHEGQGRYEHLVARAYAHCVENEVQAGGAGVDGNRLFDTMYFCKLLLETLDTLAHRNPATVYDLAQGILFLEA
jgi:hypothetical protein